MLQRLESLADGTAYDVIVLGAGGAGMAAALFAAIEGQRVLLVERTEFLGGTTAWSAATTWVPNTQHAEGSGDSPEQAATFLDHAVGNHAGAALRQAFLEAGPQAIACLEAQTEVKFRARPLHPDYIQEVPGAALRGRALEPLPFDGRALGPLFPLLRPPIPEFTVLGGMMVDRDDIGHLLHLRQPGKPGFWQAGRHAARLLARHALDRLRGPRGTRLVMGNALAGRLLLSLARRGVDILVATQTEALLREAGRVTGLVMTQAGLRRQVTARRGVILATGGFNRHPTRRAEMLPRPTPEFSPAAPGHTGEMHDLALGAGARYGEGGMDTAFWAPVSVRTRRDGSTAVFPHFVLDRGKPGIIAVNAAGRRFVNEATSYHLFARAMFRAHETVPSIPCFLVTDAEGIRTYGLGMVRPGGGGFAAFLAEGYLHQGATLAALAGKLGVDAAGLEDTVARMNRFAEAGEDPDFGRGSTAYHRVNGDAAHGPNPNLGPIGTPPFYAVKLWPGDIGAATGLVTDTAARVLDGADRPIPGLYAVGNDMHSIMGGAYPGPGITLGPGITFAWIAARHMAGH
ncbi:FAD-dependent oxidoreductase [Falsiroseomonas sp. E2-1-a20]|uniref:FAD-dependent oxidoreductase n=1 Tax=Falsiroseomonas sp. E2-1-a20 TaxID=3239300 RepID=UPI003F333C80